MLLYGPVSGYFIVVSQVNNPLEGTRRKRATLADPTSFIPLPGYTCASISVNNLLATKYFVIGDGLTYDGYTNAPLVANTQYNVFFVVASSLDGDTMMSFSQLSTPAYTSSGITTPFAVTAEARSSTIGLMSQPDVITSPPVVRTTANTVEQQTTAPAQSDTTRTIILATVIPIIVILIIVAIIIFLCLWWRKKKQQKNFSKQPWLEYKDFTGLFAMNDLSKWSDTYDLTEPRRPIIRDGTMRAYDVKVSDMPQGKSTIMIDEEYKRLPSGKIHPWTIAEQPENAIKNRFPDILAYDHSRVVLQKSEARGNYFNANFIDGYNKPKQFIAAQSPFDPVSICDFWQMVYQERCSIIVMMCHLKEEGVIKCEQYWPITEGVFSYGSLTVRHICTENYANFTIYEFDVSRDDEEGPIRRVTQFQFTDWCGHASPIDPIPFLEFVYRVKALMADFIDAPVIVHCGTGISRSAVLIAVSSLLDQAHEEHKVCAHGTRYMHHKIIVLHHNT